MLKKILGKTLLFTIGFGMGYLFGLNGILLTWGICTLTNMIIKKKKS